MFREISSAFIPGFDMKFKLADPQILLNPAISQSKSLEYLNFALKSKSKSPVHVNTTLISLLAKLFGVRNIFSVFLSIISE